MTTREDKPVTILMVGVGGYGFYYLKCLLNEVPPEAFELVGVVDPSAQNSGLYHLVRGSGVPVYSQIDEFYNSGKTAELAIIASPLHYHVKQSILALKNGSHVLCEKPIGATIQDADELIQACNASGRWVMIGYQWSYSKAILNLKKDVLAGKFGKPIQLKTLCFWTRDDAYYQRNEWAGKIKDTGGTWILDSPANNALAHFLHNMFYILGKDALSSTTPTEVSAECYRINLIENYDTIACRIQTEIDADLLFYGSHATSANAGPNFRFEFEDAVISFSVGNDNVVALDRNGNVEYYGSPEADHQFVKLFEAIKNVRNPQDVLCGPVAARSQTLCINGIQESTGEIAVFPSAMQGRDQTAKRWRVKGLDEILLKCYEQAALPGEMNVNWAKPGSSVRLSGYNYFPGGKMPGELKT